MSAPVRVRRHADGRVALFAHGNWIVVTEDGQIAWLNREHGGDGWIDLLIHSVPSPDSESPTATTWTLANGRTVTVHAAGVDVDGLLFPNRSCGLRSDALTLLAAFTALDRYQQVP